MQKTSLKDRKINTFSKKKRTHNLETHGGIHKKNATLLKTSLLDNFGKVSSLSHKSGGSLYIPKKYQLKNTDLLPAKMRP